ncbi:energy transducer TonB [Bacteroidales bacterium OttesenSCG-928-B11]|nr:energy transducer TonB [Bacteroidales bacterium OttesenSCG-928-B11]MDL2326690.1 energy transducer TonB [Bacteroidales bacterium OttesenSCG-928-A14]
MKKFISLSISFFALFVIFSTTNAYSQTDANCKGKKTGIAIVRTDGDKAPEAPKSAQKFPAYKGGAKAMCSYICKNMKYPEALKRQNAKGTTTVSFIVKSDGSIANVEVVNSSGKQEFDDEAVRLVKSFPNWKPAQKDCEAVDFKSQLDIVFDCERCGCK